MRGMHVWKGKQETLAKQGDHGATDQEGAPARGCDLGRPNDIGNTGTGSADQRAHDLPTMEETWR